MLYSEIISSPHVESVEVSGGRAKITCKDGWELTTFRATADSDARLFGSSNELYVQENQDTDFLFITTAEADFYRLKRDNLLKYDLEMREAEESAEIGKDYDLTDADGSMSNPYDWHEGDVVEVGKWYNAYPTDGSEPYLWECIKDGYPTSATDAEYFDVVGL